MRKMLMVAASLAFIGALAAPAQANSTRAAATGAVAGTVVGVGVHNGWWGPGTAATTGGFLGAAAGGILGAAATLVGYEAIGCRTFGSDPLGICVRHSWRQ